MYLGSNNIINVGSRNETSLQHWNSTLNIVEGGCSHKINILLQLLSEIKKLILIALM